MILQFDTLSVIFRVCFIFEKSFHLLLEAQSQSPFILPNLEVNMMNLIIYLDFLSVHVLILTVLVGILKILRDN